MYKESKQCMWVLRCSWTHFWHSRGLEEKTGEGGRTSFVFLQDTPQHISTIQMNLTIGQLSRYQGTYHLEMPKWLLHPFVNDLNCPPPAQHVKVKHGKEIAQLFNWGSSFLCLCFFFLLACTYHVNIWLGYLNDDIRTHLAAQYSISHLKVEA